MSMNIHKMEIIWLLLMVKYLDFVQISDHGFWSQGKFVQMNGHVKRSEQLLQRVDEGRSQMSRGIECMTFDPYDPGCFHKS